VDEPVDIEALKLRVRQHRNELGLSLRAAAEQSDVPFNTLARVEKGDLPDLANFRRIVEWLGLPPELFFQPSRIRTENTPEIIAHHLSRDPNLTDEAARHIAGLVRELYGSLARLPREVRIRLRAAPTFKPEASKLLGELLGEMQHKLTTDRGPGSGGK
jgi:transcriptional regulator with XRE-family HTH domain